MMKRYNPLFWISLLVIVLAACGTSQNEQVSAVPQDTAAEGSAGRIDGQRANPLGVNDGFHNDPAALVGNTGRPQFIEFYTDW